MIVSRIRSLPWSPLYGCRKTRRNLKFSESLKLAKVPVASWWWILRPGYPSIQSRVGWFSEVWSTLGDQPLGSIETAKPKYFESTAEVYDVFQAYVSEEHWTSRDFPVTRSMLEAIGVRPFPKSDPEIHAGLVKHWCNNIIIISMNSRPALCLIWK